MRTLKIALYVFLTCFFMAMAQAEVPVPPLTAPLIDQTNTLTAEQKANLEQTLLNFEKQKGSQIAVLIVATTAPETIEQYGLRVVEQWKLGRKKIDDGALLLIAKSDKALRIEVGYGLEGALNDATSKRIISETIVPFFKQGEFYQGITAGVHQIISVLNGEPLPEPVSSRVDSNNKYRMIYIVFIVILGLSLRGLLGRFLCASLTAGIVGAISWFGQESLGLVGINALIAFLVVLVYVDRGSFYGGGSGRGGGGFSGGGGGFGGGGASGRW